MSRSSDTTIVDLGIFVLACALGYAAVKATSNLSSEELRRVLVAISKPQPQLPLLPHTRLHCFCGDSLELLPNGETIEHPRKRGWFQRLRLLLHKHMFLEESGPAVPAPEKPYA